MTCAFAADHCGKKLMQPNMPANVNPGSRGRQRILFRPTCGVSPWVATLVCGWVTAASCPAPLYAGVDGIFGDVVMPTTSPASVLPDAVQSDVNAFLIAERQNHTLIVDLPLDVSFPSSIPNEDFSDDILPAGTQVSSYLLHADRASPFARPQFTGQIEFTETILGLIVLESTLDATDRFVGANAIWPNYPTGQIDRGIELDGSDNIQYQDHFLEFSIFADTLMDQVRIITMPEPEGFTFSVDVQGPTAGSFGSSDNAPNASFPGNSTLPISGGDILTVGGSGGTGPNPPRDGPFNDPDDLPGIVVFGGDASFQTRGLDLSTVSIGPLNEAEAEVDALSYGRDEGNSIQFSVDEFVRGKQIGKAPNEVILEGASNLGEASADVFTFRGSPVERTLPTVYAHGNLKAIDGNASDAGSVGLGLVEPNPPNPLPPRPFAQPNEFDVGDNLDAMDVDTTPSDLAGHIYFSLDGGFRDPFETDDSTGGPRPNIGTAFQNLTDGVNSGAAVLVQIPLAGRKVYASPDVLGLDQHCGKKDCNGSDDLDGLILQDFGDPTVFDPVGEGDVLLFSVRRGSSVIGQLDSRLGEPIEEGDILTVPRDGSNVPRIFLPAEYLGLDTRRSSGAPEGEDLVSMDFAITASVVDGDMDCSGLPLDNGDADAFALAIRDPNSYTVDFFLCGSPPTLHGNFDGDVDFDFDDITGFVSELEATGSMSALLASRIILGIPEPTSLSLAGLALLVLVGRRRCHRVD